MHRLAELQKIYDSLPKIQCKGLCWEYCGPVNATQTERMNISTLQTRKNLPYVKLRPNLEQIYEIAMHVTNQKSADEIGMCPYLIEHRCQVYEARPIICRLFGLTQGERVDCTFGCKPERYLTSQEINAIIKAVEDIS